MRPVHYLTLAAAILLIVILYWGGNTIPPAKKTGNTPPMAGMSPGPNTMKPASFDSMLSAAKSQLVTGAADSVKTIEKELTAIRDSSGMAVVFYRLAHFWNDHKQLRIAGYYTSLNAKLENSEKKLNFAGQFFLERLAEDSTQDVQVWDGMQAVDCFQRALQLNPDNDTAKIGLAKGYVLTGEPMKGVGLLREIVQKRPDDVPANMVLGEMSIQSGQMDKAISRFETVLKKEPSNVDAMVYLAQVYEAQGAKDKAIEMLERAKKTVDNPIFSRNVDEHINSLK